MLRKSSEVREENILSLVLLAHLPASGVQDWWLFSVLEGAELSKLSLFFQPLVSSQNLSNRWTKLIQILSSQSSNPTSLSWPRNSPSPIPFNLKSLPAQSQQTHFSRIPPHQVSHSTSQIPELKIPTLAGGPQYQLCIRLSWGAFKNTSALPLLPIINCSGVKPQAWVFSNISPGNSNGQPTLRTTELSKPVLCRHCPQQACAQGGLPYSFL